MLFSLVQFSFSFVKSVIRLLHERQLVLVSAAFRNPTTYVTHNKYGGALCGAAPECVGRQALKRK